MVENVALRAPAGVNADVDVRRGVEGAGANAVQPPPPPVAPPAAAGGAILQVMNQVGQKRQTFVERELSRYRGAEFDNAYLGQQVLAHLELLAMLETFGNLASPEFRRVCDQATASTEQHLTMARRHMEQLAAESANALRRPAVPRR